MPDARTGASLEDLAPWAAQVQRYYQAEVTHAVILHNNVADWVIPNKGLASFLATLFSDWFIIVYYNQSGGLRFAVPSMEERAKQVLGMDSRTRPEADPYTSVLADFAGNGGIEETEWPRDPAVALPLLERLLHHKGDSGQRPIIVVIEFAESLVPATDMAGMSESDRINLITLQRWGTDQGIDATGNLLFLITGDLSSIHPRVRAASAKYVAFDIPLPDQVARRRFIDLYVEDRDRATFTWGPGLTAATMANATAGLMLVHIEDIFLRAKQEGHLTLELIRERKKEVIKSEYANVIEVSDPVIGFDDLGGMVQIKEFWRTKVIEPMRDGRTYRCPNGVLLLGPPGTGKSVSAEAVAKACGFNFVRLNMARIYQGLVGASERNLELALRVIDAMHPCIVFIDEVDQTVSRGGGGDSGVSSRVFKRLLEYMADTSHRGRVLFLLASNRPDLIDPAMRRSGRVDKILAYLVGDREDRAGMFLVQARRLPGMGDVAISGEVLDKSEGWTAADIELACVKAVEIHEDEGLAPSQALEQAVKRIRPSTNSVTEMTDAALREINDLDLLPPQYRARLDAQRAIIVETTLGEEHIRGEGRRPRT